MKLGFGSVRQDCGIIADGNRKGLLPPGPQNSVESIRARADSRWSYRSLLISHNQAMDWVCNRRTYVGTMSRGEIECFTIGPDGERLTLADLPDPRTRHWVARRKARIVAAVKGGLISCDEALARYQITAEEFEIWTGCMTRSGMRGLRVTKIHRNSVASQISLCDS